MFHFFALSGPSKSLTGERERTAAVTALVRPFGAESDPLLRPPRRSQPRSELRASNGGFLNLFVFSPPRRIALNQGKSQSLDNSQLCPEPGGESFAALPEPPRPRLFPGISIKCNN